MDQVYFLYNSLSSVPFGEPTRTDKIINHEYRKKISQILTDNDFDTTIVDKRLTTSDLPNVNNIEDELFDIALTLVSVRCGIPKENLLRRKSTFYNFVIILVIAVLVLLNIAHHKIPLPFANAPSVDEMFPEIKTRFS